MVDRAGEGRAVNSGLSEQGEAGGGWKSVL